MTVAVLETPGDQAPSPSPAQEAVRLYEGHGYRPIDRYHDFPDPTHFFEKALIEPGSVPPG